MPFTTPPRPTALTDRFPELLDHTTTTTRLHPRPGNPTSADSSVGGPLRWPASEPWPICAEDHRAIWLRSPADVRRQQALQDASRTRALTPAEVAESSALLDAGEGSSYPSDPPAPLVPIAQLYRRDVPGFIGPDDADLLQVLWCPMDHEGDHPIARVRWRRAAEIGPLLEEVPEPELLFGGYLPVPCVVQPEQVTELQNWLMLPERLRERIGDQTPYQDLTGTPGWRVGGFVGWGVTDPWPVDCVSCGTAMAVLLIVDSVDSAVAGSWRPREEPAGSWENPPEVTVGRGYSLNVLHCPASFDHPVTTLMS